MNSTSGILVLTYTPPVYQGVVRVEEHSWTLECGHPEEPGQIHVSGESLEEVCKEFSRRAVADPISLLRTLTGPDLVDAGDRGWSQALGQLKAGPRVGHLTRPPWVLRPEDVARLRSDPKERS